MYLAMGIVAFLCTLYGVAPGLLYGMLPYGPTYHPYTAYHLVETIQLLTFTFIGFWILRDKLAGEACIALDTDWFYRRGAFVADKALVQPVNILFTACGFLRGKVAETVIRHFRNPYRWLRMNTGPADRFLPDRERPFLGGLVIWILLGFVLISAFAIAG
jgi:multicomponent Na+:H+ antiporter subunit D